ncbi:Glutamate--cysteine ligase [Holothuria leucospilota]|uniref:Glutamate--cysteine ligase n=1 Tax=Holothuria leucospilota TaxID=206669 RepID=A0A9Q1BYG5_HOLLE|nr:Glutamate--cysteine ligase [Holothuria leucospilota]
MGVLETGVLLNWDETKRYADHIRRHGINQFINLFHKVKNNTYPHFKWGDEV